MLYNWGAFQPKNAAFPSQSRIRPFGKEALSSCLGQRMVGVYIWLHHMLLNIVYGWQKPGKWCALHVRIAHFIFNHQTKVCAATLIIVLELIIFLIWRKKVTVERSLNQIVRLFALLITLPLLLFISTLIHLTSCPRKNEVSQPLLFICR